MSEPEIRLFANAQNELGEGPMWCPERRALWWIDVAVPTLMRADGVDGKVHAWPLPKVPGSMAQIDANRWLIAFRNGLAVVEVPDMSPRWLQPSGFSLGDERINDGKVDRAGRFWFGTMDRKVKSPIGALYTLEGNQVRRFAQAYTLSNGIGWSPDNRTMYSSDTISRCIYAHDYDLEHATLANRRIFVEVDQGHGGPDGLTVDAEGGVWSAMFERSAVHRYRPDGKLDHVIQLPVTRPTSCIFGGDNLRTLYITTARYGLDEAALAREPWAGGVLAVDVPYQGLAEPLVQMN